MNNSIIKRSYNWLIERWQKTKTVWNSNSGKHIFQRTVLIILSLIYAIFATVFILVMIPVIFIAAMLISERLKAEMVAKRKPVIINVTPDTV